MSEPRVTAIVINWRRPDNVQRIIRALRQSSEPCRIIVCDVLVDGHYLKDNFFEGADEVLHLSRNHGGFNRLVPAMLVQSEFTYFHDDDMLPGPEALRALVHCADGMLDMGALGQIGRVYPGGEFGTGNVLRGSHCCVPVDNVIRGALVRSALLPGVMHFWQRHGKQFLTPEGLVHDDLLLSFALRAAGHINQLMPVDNRNDTMVNSQELPDQYAFCRRPSHRPEREVIVRWFDQQFPGRLTPILPFVAP